MIETWTRGDADANMPEDILVELAQIITRHPWWIARAELALAFLEGAGIRPPARVLEAGAGWGVNLEALERRGYSVVGLDISRQTLARLDRADRRLVEADVTQPPPAGVEPFDAVLGLDLIEHLDDDRPALAHFGSLLRPGGLLIVSVPALPWLFSEFDDVQGHRRRYTPERLRQAFEGQPQLRLERVAWWGSWMVPLVWLRKAMPGRKGVSSPAEVYKRYLRVPGGPVLSAMRAAYAWEKPRTLAGRSPIGTSLIALARRV